MNILGLNISKNEKIKKKNNKTHIYNILNTLSNTTNTNTNTNTNNNTNTNTDTNNDTDTNTNTNNNTNINIHRGRNFEVVVMRRGLLRLA